MSIINRLKRMESQIITEDKNQAAWDFSRLTNEQLENLITLHESSDKAEVIKYTKKLIDEGLLIQHTF
jgi:hypothetical protein